MLDYYDSTILPQNYVIHCIISWFGIIGTIGTFVCCGVLIYALYKKWSWRCQWERIVALVPLLCAMCGLCFSYSVDYKHPYLPGGILGYITSNTIAIFVGYHLRILCLYLISLCSLLLVTQLGYMPIVQGLVRVFIVIYEWMHQKRIIQQTHRAIYSVVLFLYKPIAGIKQWVIDFAKGTVFERSYLTIPDDYEIQAKKIAELYTMLQMPSFEHQNNITYTTIDYNNEHEIHDIRYASALYNEEQEKISNADPMQSEVDINTAQQIYELPDITALLDNTHNTIDTSINKEFQTKALILEEKLERFGIAGKVTSIKRGPVVTLYEYQPSIDTKISKIIALEDDLALALQAMSIRIIAPIPGREVVGFEVSNTHTQPVLLASIFTSERWHTKKDILPLALGVDTVGNSVVVDLVSMPHLLIAGSTGSGKSVALNTMLVSLICSKKPNELKLILIDPKRLEFATYVDIPHLLFPIVADPRRAIPVLQWVIKEMEQRYDCMAHVGVRTIKEYNRIYHSNKSIQPLPYIVIVIDELSDLMMTAGRDIEDALARLAQMARAAGIHLIVATQRPSVDVITGLIKVNFPSRISFRVTSRIDSRTILDCGGAEKLLGRGDMLFLDSHTSGIRRLHGAFIADVTIAKIVDQIRIQQQPEYQEFPIEYAHLSEYDNQEHDILYKEILDYINTIDEISISLLQRRFKIGFNRSARIIDYLEKQGRIMPPEGSKSRKVIH